MLRTSRIQSDSFRAIALAICVSVAAMLLLSPSAYAQENSLTATKIISITRSETTPGAIDVRGKAQPRVNINVEIISDDAGPLLRDQTTTNEAGDWDLTVGDSSFKDGGYTLRAIVQDKNGVLGPVTEVRGYKVQPKPLLSVNGVDFGWLDAFLLSIFAIFLLLAFGSWYYEHRRRIHEQQLLVAEREIQSISHNLLDEVERLDNLIKESKGMDPHVAAEAEYLLKSQHAKLEKMHNYMNVGGVKI